MTHIYCLQKKKVPQCQTFGRMCMCFPGDRFPEEFPKLRMHVSLNHSRVVSAEPLLFMSQIAQKKNGKHKMEKTENLLLP